MIGGVYAATALASAKDEERKPGADATALLLLARKR
jgi:hypothetical protein